MLAVNYSTIRNNLKNYCDEATDNKENRLVYNIDEHGNLWIIACKGHYED